MPLSRYKNSGKRVVPLERYISESLLDAGGTRQYDESWTAFAFSALMSASLDRDKRLPVVKRGLPSTNFGDGADHLQEYGEHILPDTLYDERKASTMTEELCAAIKKFGLPMYFHTQTANMKLFPGLREAYAAIEKHSLRVDHFLVLITRTWHRCSPLAQSTM